MVDTPSVAVLNLGCPMNQVDAEVMLGQLVEAGYAVAESPAQADVVVVNTCSFIQDAKEESIQTILEAAALKRTGRCRALLVSGCLPQRYHPELPALLPEVDGFVGTGEFPRIAAIVRSVLRGQDDNRDSVKPRSVHCVWVSVDIDQREPFINSTRPKCCRGPELFRHRSGRHTRR